YDLAQTKVASYCSGVDPNRQLSGDEFRTATHLEFTVDPKQLGEADRIIVAVPTPVDSAHQPDFGPLRGASETVGKHMRRGAVSFSSRRFIRAPRKKSACPYSN